MGACVGNMHKEKKMLKMQTQQHLENMNSRPLMLEVLLKKGGRITKEYTLLNPAIGKGKHPASTQLTK